MDSRPDGRPFGCEPNGPCTDCRIPTLLRFLCHKNVTRIVEMCALSERLRRGQGSWGVPDARGSNQASATTTDCRSIISLHSATIRIDKNAHCTLRRSRLRVSSFPNFLELQCDLRQATLVLTMLTFRSALMSRIGGWPKTRLYSRVNWLTLS